MYVSDAPYESLLILSAFRPYNARTLFENHSHLLPLMTAVAAEPSHRTSAPSHQGSHKAAPVTTRGLRKRGFWGAIRSVIFWSHLVLGVAGGAIILVMSVTGALLGFERQLIARFDGVARVTPPATGAARLPFGSLLGRNGLAIADVASVVIKAEPTEPVSVRFRDREKAAQLLDPFTAEAIAPVPRGRTAEFMSWLRGWHRWLGATGEKRPLMRKLTGASNLAFLLLVLSGLYLWWPRKLNRATLKTAAVFNPRLQGKAREFNWHNSLGFWCAIPLAFVVATGVFISYSWPGQWMDRLWGSEKERAAAIKAMNTPPESVSRATAPRVNAPQANAPQANAAQANAPRGNALAENTAQRTSARGTVGPAVGAAPSFASVDGMLTAVQHTRPEWQSITITPPAARDSVVQIAVAEGNTYRPDLKTQFFFNAETGALARTTNFDSLSTSRKIRGWTRFGHTGEVFGLTGQTIATFVSLVGAILVYTGLALGWRRMVAFIRRRKRGRAAPVIAS